MKTELHRSDLKLGILQIFIALYLSSGLGSKLQFQVLDKQLVEEKILSEILIRDDAAVLSLNKLPHLTYSP